MKPVSYKQSDTICTCMQPSTFKGKYRIASTRLPNWDYSYMGAYFITICTHGRRYRFGDIVNGSLPETVPPKICIACWSGLSLHYRNCIPDAFVLMPNHVHGIIILQNAKNETGLKPVSTEEKQYSLFEIVRGFKTFTAREINKHENAVGNQFWQSRFYDRVIRDDAEYLRIRQYITDNPAKWEDDRNNTENLYM